MFERILCAVDGSDVSEKVIAAAQDLARKSGGEVVVFHAYHVPEEYLGLAKHYATGTITWRKSEASSPRSTAAWWKRPPKPCGAPA